MTHVIRVTSDLKVPQERYVRFVPDGSFCKPILTNRFGAERFPNNFATKRVVECLRKGYTGESYWKTAELVPVGEPMPDRSKYEKGDIGQAIWEVDYQKWLDG